MDEDETSHPAPPRLTVDIVSLFPAIFESWLRQGVVSRAVERGIAAVRLLDLRPFGIGRHHVTDDYPFGGGVGMVLKPEPVFAAIESLELPSHVPVILLSPRGRQFTQTVARELSALDRFVLLSGHYEGVDERIVDHLVTDEISIGDYVLSCGELAAMVVADAAVRLLPGSLAEGAAAEESHQHSLLEYPHYTRPADFRGCRVPDVLLSGHHAMIERWRREQAIRATARRRPDLLEGAYLDVRERSIAEEELGGASDGGKVEDGPA